MHFFTSITANYLPKARVLARSVKRHNPDAVFHLVLSDCLPPGFDLTQEPFDTLIELKDLGIDNLESWIFKHSVVELCTAVKGPTFHYLLERKNADKVIYFDPDIVVLDELTALSEILDQAGVVLTPHQVIPEKTLDAVIDNEVCSLKHGVYNLGFLAVRNCPAAMAFVRWWRDRLLHFCYDDIPNGLFTDQKWVDLAPAFFDDIRILRDKAYNIATWNLTHREVLSDREGHLTVEGNRVKFYHFSGFDSGAQEIMLKKYAGGNEALFQFRRWYLDELEKEGQAELGNLPCCYSFYSNGERIERAERLLYRARRDLIEAFKHPSVLTEDKINYYDWFRDNHPDGIAGSDRTEMSDRERELLAKLMEKERELGIVLHSKSWRITAPLRAAVTAARRWMDRLPKDTRAVFTEATPDHSGKAAPADAPPAPITTASRPAPRPDFLDVAVKHHIEQNVDKIPGWLNREASYLTAYLLSHQRKIDLKGNIAEIGVYQGKYLSLLYLFCRPELERVIGLDAFIGGEDYESPKKRIYKHIAEYCGNTSCLDIVPANTLDLTPDAMADITSREVRFISVDGGHTADVVYHDLVLAEAVLKERGVIALDDAFSFATPGVTEGLCRFFLNGTDRKIAPFAQCYNKLFLTTVAAHAQYLALTQRFLEEMADLPACGRTTDFMAVNKENNFTPELFGYEMIGFM